MKVEWKSHLKEWRQTGMSKIGLTYAGQVKAVSMDFALQMTLLRFLFHWLKSFTNWEKSSLSHLMGQWYTKKKGLDSPGSFPVYTEQLGECISAALSNNNLGPYIYTWRANSTCNNVYLVHRDGIDKTAMWWCVEHKYNSLASASVFKVLDSFVFA